MIMFDKVMHVQMCVYARQILLGVLNHSGGALNDNFNSGYGMLKGNAEGSVNKYLSRSNQERILGGGGGGLSFGKRYCPL